MNTQGHIKLSLGPNPAIDNIFIETNTPGKILIMDMQGRRVRSDYILTKKLINVAELDNGIYLLIFTTSQQAIVKKIIVHQ